LSAGVCAGRKRGMSVPKSALVESGGVQTPKRKEEKIYMPP